MKTPREIGEILKEARRKKGLNKEAVRKAIHIQPNMIDALEEGKADEHLSRIYVLLFLKKYAKLLDLDPAALTADYKRFYPGEEKQLFSLEKEEKPISIKLNVDIQKWILPAISAVLILITVFFVLSFSIKAVSYVKGKVKLAKKTPPATERQAPKNEESDKLQKSDIFPIPEDKPITLSLQASDDVWMRVKRDGKIVFENTLPKGKIQEWSADDKIDLWAGRAEVLNFTISGKRVGKIASGNVKNIQLSRQGLKIGNKWLLKEE